MTTKRKRNKVKENQGSRYVQSIVEDQNCIYQEVALNNDQGNDCYIEFITDEVATSFCVFAQVKSGKSYRDNSGYKIPTDQNHLAYWNNHTNPVAGIVYDELKREAFWINISKYLSENPQVLEQATHSIRVSPVNRFSDFSAFKDHFTDYIQEYKSFENYGKSLDNFAQLDHPAICYDGFKSLYSNHRNRSSAWFYIISNFGKIKEKGIQGNILRVLSNYVPSDDIFWTQKDIEFLHKADIKKLAEFLTGSFGTKEVSLVIEFMREGVVRGSFTYLLFKVLTLIEDVHKILLEITYSENYPERRDFDFWLFVHFSQWKSKDYTINKINEYLERYPEADQDRIIEGMREVLLNDELILIG